MNDLQVNSPYQNVLSLHHLLFFFFLHLLINVNVFKILFSKTFVGIELIYNVVGVADVQSSYFSIQAITEQ